MPKQKHIHSYYCFKKYIIITSYHHSLSMKIKKCEINSLPSVTFVTPHFLLVSDHISGSWHHNRVQQSITDNNRNMNGCTRRKMTKELVTATCDTMGKMCTNLNDFCFKFYFLYNDYTTVYLIKFWLLCVILFVFVTVILGSMLPSEETNRKTEFIYWTSKCRVLTYHHT